MPQNEYLALPGVGDMSVYFPVAENISDKLGIFSILTADVV